ncbi:ABC transporter ATP-binding protein, partial [Pseudomonas aeruginosa]|nr:ABC transporter ATP-binding protein [Pseudomonas aeruginosa]
RQALESMLGQYRGALLVVSHDPVFLRRLRLDGALEATDDGWRLRPEHCVNGISAAGD